MVGKLICLGIAVGILTVSGSMAQVVIWQEHFDEYADGTKTGNNNNQLNPDIDWVSGACTACIDTADWWEIRSGALEARDVNEVVYLITEEIDISGFSDVKITLDISETGDHEGPYFGLDACPDQVNEDFVNVLYRIDGGTWELISNSLGWCGLYELCSSHTLYGDDGINSGDCRDNDTDWGSVTIEQGNILGNALEIKVEVINSSATEFIRLDELNVEGNILLPVALKTFRASALSNRIQLYWQTLSETNNDHFIIERSRYGTFGWEPIANVPGAGISNEPREYRYEDLNPYGGKSYYRLKQVDFDGHFVYLPIAVVIANSLANPYPNPASDYLIIPFPGSFNNALNVQLYDVMLRKIEVPMEISGSHLWMDLKYIARGTYILNTCQDGINCQKHTIVVY